MSVRVEKPLCMVLHKAYEWPVVEAQRRARKPIMDSSSQTRVYLHELTRGSHSQRTPKTEPDTVR
jgi:hypothetical protein